MLLLSLLDYESQYRCVHKAVFFGLWILINEVVNFVLILRGFSYTSHNDLSLQVILKAILPPYLQYLKEQTTKQFSLMQARDEMSVINSLSASVRALILCCEPMAR